MQNHENQNGDVTQLERYISMLDSGEPQVRFKAISHLIELEDIRAVPYLFRLLYDSDDHVRWHAARALGDRIKSNEIVPELIDALWNGSPEIRSAATYVLVGLKDERILPAMEEMLKSDDVALQKHAVHLITTIGDKTSANSLLDVLSNIDDRELQKFILIALGQTQNPIAVPAVTQFLTSNDIDICEAAIGALGYLGDETVINSLLEFTENTNPRLRSASVEALGRMKDAAVGPKLLVMLNDTDPHVRKETIRSLLNMEFAQVTPHLLRLLDDTSAQVRAIAASGLGEFRSMASLPRLLQLVHDDSPDVRAAAVIALGKLGDKSVVPEMLFLLKDFEIYFYPTLTVSDAAAVALGKLGDNRAVPALLKALKSNMPQLRYRAAIALGQIGSSDAVQALANLLDDEEIPVPSHIHKYQRVKDAATWALEQIGTSEALQALRESQAKVN